MRIIALFLAVSVCGVSVATSFDPEDLQLNAMLRDADAIVHAEVVERTVAKNPDDGIPHTFYRLRILEVIIGASDQTEVVIRVWVAMDRDRSIGFVGTPNFEVGEEIVAFIRDNGDEAIPILNDHAGVLWINTSPGGKRFLTDAEGYPINAVTDGPLKADRNSANAQCVRSSVLAGTDQHTLAPSTPGQSASNAPLANCVNDDPHRFDDAMAVHDFNNALRDRAKRLSINKSVVLRSMPWAEFDVRSRSSLRRYSQVAAPPEPLLKSGITKTSDAKSAIRED